MSNTNIIEELEKNIIESDSIPEAEKQILLHNLIRAREQRVNILITGATGCGKSSTINAMFGEEVAKVGVGVDPETMEITHFVLNEMTLWDSPGLGDGKEKDIIHAKKITELLFRRDETGNALIDMVLVIVDGSTRDIGTTYELIENVIIPALGSERTNRLLVAINQADLAMKGRYWNHEECRPEPELQKFLDEKAASIHRRLLDNTGVDVMPIYYSAGFKEEGIPQEPPYNLSKLLAYILKAIPPEKRLVVAEKLNRDEEMWKRSDELEDYHESIRRSLTESVVTGARNGAEIGGAIGSTFGKVGEVVGKVVGGFVGGVVGFVKGLFRR